jgi:predicted alpha/beta-hydrolase family hydrolase
MDSPFLAFFAARLAACGYRIARFEFPYMAKRRLTGMRAPPDRLEALVDCWRQVIAGLDARRLVIGGKSLGGRIASLVADEAKVPGLVCLGYPFHPPGRPADEGRIGHLRSLATPALILQGTRDPFGSPAEVGGYVLSPAIRLHWLADGDHGLAPPKHSGRTPDQNWRAAAAAIAAFLAGLA